MNHKHRFETAKAGRSKRPCPQGAFYGQEARVARQVLSYEQEAAPLHQKQGL